VRQAQQGLPQGWKAFFDPELRRMYYYNSLEKKSFWDKPAIISNNGGGKSGSGITRKRRLRLKKSRNVTRHKGGKKSVRFSARVKLNKGRGNGNGKGKGSSSMNKRTCK
jgi:hypothetical protein